MAGQDDDFRAAVLGNSDGGYVPSYAPAPSIGKSAEEQAAQAAKFREVMTAAVPGAGMLAPYATGMKGALDVIGGIANPVGLVGGLAMNPESARHIGQSALGLEHDVAGRANSKLPEGLASIVGNAQGAVRPMGDTEPTIKPAPSLLQQSRAAIAGGAGIVGGGGLGALERNVRDAQQRQREGFDAASDAQIRLGQDKAARTLQESDMREADAIARERDAHDQQRIEAEAQASHATFLQRQEKLADEIATQKVDPSRLLKNADIGEQITYGMGMALGEMFGNGRNAYAERVDKALQRDTELQASENDAKRASYNARSSLFDKMLAETGDRRLASMQTLRLLYDATDKKMLADAARLGIPELQTNAEILSQEWQQKKQVLDVQIAQTSLERARAMAAANAAAQRAAEERARQHAIDMIKLDQEQQKIDISRGGKEKETGERAVVLDGQDSLAVNKEAAGKWNEYNHGRAVFNLALNKLKTAREAGDVGAYDAARAQLIEEYPKLLGYTRAPTEGQISHTVGPNAIPEYNHWYNHVGTAGVGWKVAQGRGEEKIKFLEETLATSDKAMRENTFGAKAGISPNFRPDKPAEKK